MANPLLPTFPMFIPQQPILFPVAPKPTNTIPTPVLLALLENMKNMNTLLSMSNMRQPVNTFTQFQPIPETRPMETEQTSEPSTEMCSEHNSDEEVEEKQVTKSDSVSVKVQVRNSRTTARSEPIEITYEQLAKHFHRSLESAASSIVSSCVPMVFGILLTCCPGNWKIYHEGCLSTIRHQEMALHPQGPEAQETLKEDSGIGKSTALGLEFMLLTWSCSNLK